MLHKIPKPLKAAVQDGLSVARAITPDLRGVPVHVSCAFPLPGDVLGRHEGREGAYLIAGVDDGGFGMLLNAPEILAEREPQYVAKRVLLHEIAHHLEHVDNPNDPFLKAWNAIPQEQLVKGLKRHMRDQERDRLLGVEEPNVKPRWHHHELPFIRACVHLAWRSCHVANDPIIPSFAGEFYGLSDPREYIRLFHQECEEYRFNRIRTVLRMTPPPAAQELFDKDTQTAATNAA